MSKSLSFFINPLIEFTNNSFAKIFLIVACLNLFSTVIFNHIVWSDIIYLNESGLDKSNEIFLKGTYNRFIINLIVDLISPVWLIIKLGTASILVFLVAYILQINIIFSKVLKSFIVSFIFIIFGDIIYSSFLILVNPPFFRNDVLYFYPFSFLYFIDIESGLYSYYFIWSRINLFQLIFIVSLFLLFRNWSKLSSKNAIILTVSYVFFYGIFLVFWFLFYI